MTKIMRRLLQNHLKLSILSEKPLAKFRNSGPGGRVALPGKGPAGCCSQPGTRGSAGAEAQILSEGKDQAQGYLPKFQYIKSVFKEKPGSGKSR
ncbi:MAG: hypothetical protein ACO1O1_09225 [Adhaeribacter sp.]